MRTRRPAPRNPKIVVGFGVRRTDDEAVGRLFARIDAECGRLDVLVNSAWGGYERMVEDGRFTCAAPFWEQPSWRWDAMVTVGVRSAFVASQFAARRMVPAQRGLIVNISHWAARKRIGNTICGVAKASQRYGFTDIDGRSPRALTLADV